MRSERPAEAEDERTPSGREALSSAVDEVAARLRDRRVRVDGTETSTELASMLEAVEQFERAVTLRAGDLFLDSGDAPEPDDPAFVLPRRRDDEGAGAYIGRLEAATASVLQRPPLE